MVVALLGGLAWSSVARAMTMFDGGPVGGQVWTAAGSPYLVRGVLGNLTVAAGEEFRIEAGTTVLFDDGYGRVLLTVEGKLTINGTAAAPVTLQAATDAISWMGITITNESAVVRMTDAVIRGAITGLTISRLADVQIARTTFDSCNTGLDVTKGPFTFDSLVVSNNHTGVSVVSTGSVTLPNALFQGNTLVGLQVMNGKATAINCTFDRNYDGVQALPLSAGANTTSVEIQNAILSNNRHAGVQDYGTPAASAVHLSRATFWGNTANAAYSTVTVDGATAPPGTEVAVADPKYVSATDLHLTAGSPCIDSGAATGAPDHDLDGNRRPAGAAVDRGAYEFASGGAGGTGGGGTSGGGGGGSGGSGGRGGGDAGGSTGAGGAAAGTSGGGGTGTGGASGGTGGASAGAGGASAGGASAGTGGASVGAAGNGGGTGGVATGGNGGSRGPFGDAAKDDGCGCDAGGAPARGAAVLLLVIAIAIASQRSRRRPLTLTLSPLRGERGPDRGVRGSDRGARGSDYHRQP